MKLSIRVRIMLLASLLAVLALPAVASERVTVAEKGFSIVPPAGWEVVRDYPGLSLFLRAPKVNKSIYQRTIQVTAYKGVRYIDDITAQEYSKKLVEDFGPATRSNDYRIRNHQIVDTEDNGKGLLFYTEFSVDGVNLMQAHLLVSAKARHYLVTFTDVAAGFDVDAGQAPTLPEAWASMISIKTDTVAGGRFDTTVTLTTIFVVLGLVIGSVSWLKFRRAADEYKGLAGDLEREANREDDEPRSTFGTNSRAG